MVAARDTQMETDLDDQQRQRVDEFRRKHRIALLTMLFTDIVGSTGLKQALGDRAAIALIERHHALIREALGRFAEAEEIDTAGDSFFCVFAKPSDAAHFALIVQRGMRDLARETGFPVLDRIGIHVGEVFVHQRSEGARDLFGIQIDTTARIMSLGGADQILLSRFAFDNARQVLRGHDLDGVGELSWLNHGYYEMKGVEEPVEVCEVGEIGAGALLAPGDSEKAHRFHSPDAEPVLGWRPSAGQRVPNTQWTLERALGEGGFGEVWLAHHETLKQRRVIKFCFRADRVRSLKREVTLFRILRERVGEQRGIVTVHDVFFDEPPFYIVMDYVDGPNLAEWTAAHAPLAEVPLATRLEIVAQVADALQVAHDAGVIHRDVKPSNILIAEENGTPQVKLTDFGIGQVVSAEALAGVTKLGFTQTMMSSSNGTGTQLYMAPELLTGLPATTRSDLYSLGVVLYQLIIGDLARPVTADWPDDIADPLLREDLRKCLAGDAAKRFTGAGDLAVRLRSLDQRRNARTAEDAAHAASERRAYRRGLLRAAGLAGLVVAAVSALAVFAFRQAGAARASRARAEHSAKAEAEAHVKAEEMLTKVQLQRAEELMQTNDDSGGLAYFAHVLRRNPHDQITASRLLSALRDRSRPRMTAGPHKAAPGTFLHWTADRNVLCLVNDQEAGYWNTATGSHGVKSDYTGLAGYSKYAQPNADGSRILLFPRSDRARIYDTHTGLPVAADLIHEDGYNEGKGWSGDELPGLMGSFDTENRWVATVVAATSMCIWDVVTGQRVGKVTPVSPPTYVAFHPNSKSLALGCRNGSVEIRTADGDQWKVLQQVQAGAGMIKGLRYIKTGLFVVSSGNALIFYPLMDDQTLGVPVSIGRGASNYDLIQDENAVVTAESDHKVRFWNFTTGQAIGEPLDLGELVYKVKVSSDGSRFLTITRQGVQVWGTHGRHLIARTRSFAASVVSAVFNQDDTEVAISLADGTVSVWRFDQNRALPVTYPTTTFNSIAAIHENGELIAVGDTQGGGVAVWDIKSGHRRSPVMNSVGKAGHLHDIKFQPGNERLWTGTDSTQAIAWDWQTGKQVGNAVTGDGYVWRLAFDHSGKRLAVKGNNFRVWNLAAADSKQWTFREINPNGYFGFFARNGLTCLVKKPENGLRLMDSETGIPISDYFSEGRSNILCVTPDLEQCVTTDGAGTARVWDVRSGKPLTGPLHHQAGIRAASLNLESGVVATASLDNTARLWRVPGGEPLGMPMRHQEMVLVVEISPEGRRVATSSLDRTIRLWDIPSGRPLTESLAVLGGVSEKGCFWHSTGTGLIAFGSSPAQCWDLPSVDVDAPFWLADWAEAVGGFRLDERGELVSLSLDSERAFEEKAAASTGNDVFARTLKWYYQPLTNRPLSPNATVTRHELVATLCRAGVPRADWLAVEIASEESLPWSSLAWHALNGNPEISSATLQLAERAVAYALRRNENDGLAALAQAALLAEQDDHVAAIAAIRKALLLIDGPDEIVGGKSLLAELLAASGESEEVAKLTGELLGTITPADREDKRRSHWLSLRREALLRLGNSDSLAADNAALLGLLARSAAASAELVNLGAFYNKRLDEGITGTEQTFNEMPYGLQTFAGVPFDARGLVLLRARSKKATGAYEADLDDPLSVTGVPVESKCQRLHFLHCVVSPTVPSGKEIGAYVIHYSDGQEVRIPLRLDREFGDRHRIGLESLGGAVPPPEAGHKIAWQGHDKWSRENPMAHTFTYLFTWENPRPEVPVKSLDIVSNADDAGIAVFGITRE